ncbi:MAG: maltose alpha-D-glucosyltransferase, partial [Rubrivivax sp.]|nr:maltose alpha-D-glucosyltransferase [Pyrinomonadaceae bacterium]
MADTDKLLDDPLWFKDAVFYEIYVRGFYDSDGDGIGDFRGLTEKLDYLEWLGVDCLWLLPMYASPLRDGGYDIADYYAILPEYGTLEDFRTFLDAAHARGIRVITDLVVNHTSDAHPWFKEASRAPDSPRRDWYVWSDTLEKYKDARIIFTDTEKSNWTWCESAKAFYWHRFFSHQPDLNYDNPEVQGAMLDAVDYWLDFGIDGFRVDAVPYLYEREGTNCENLAETHGFLKKLRAHAEERHPNALLLGEANQWPEDVVEYFGGGREFHMNYHFPIMPRLFMALRQEDRRPIVEILERTPDIPANCQWGMFLRNHDELTLEMVTDEERDYLYNEYATDRRMRLNVGIRRRLAPLLDNSRRRIELLHAILFSMPGSPFIYYGDEIGMGDNIYLGDRDGVRTPMQWSPDRNAGFSKADFEKLYFPVINNPLYGFQSVNVESQRRYDSSLLHWMRQMILLRKQHHVFGRGTMRFVKPENRKIFAFVREHEGETVL